jgi:hypothetical protein
MSAVSSSLSPRPAASARSLELLQRRTMRVLFAAHLLGALGLAAGGTAAGLPLAVLVLGSGDRRDGRHPRPGRPSAA